MIDRYIANKYPHHALDAAVLNSRNPGGLLGDRGIFQQVTQPKVHVLESPPLHRRPITERLDIQTGEIAKAVLKNPALIADEGFKIAAIKDAARAATSTVNLEPKTDEDRTRVALALGVFMDMVEPDDPTATQTAIENNVAKNPLPRIDAVVGVVYLQENIPYTFFK